MNDNELDDLFRNAAERQEPTMPPEGAWDEFYDKYLKEKEKKDKLPFWVEWLNNNISAVGLLFNWKWGAAIVGVICLLYFFIPKPQISVQQNMVYTVPTAHQRSTKQQKTISSQHVAVVISDNLDKKKKTGQVKTESTILKNSSAIVTNPWHLDSYIKTAGSNTFLSTIQKTKNALSTAIVSLSERVIKQQEKEVLNKSNEIASDSSREKSVSKRYKTLQDVHNDEYILASKDREEKEMISTNRSKWQIGLLGGTNLSMASGTFSNTPGANAGIMVQHRINKGKLSVETGVVRESMTYNVNQGSFHPNGQTVPSSVNNMSGRCTMIDVPVNVRYDVVSGKSSDAFVSTGASAMVMINQTYAYQYGSNIINQDVSGKGGNNVAATVNLSVGYEKHFKSGSIQIAPYVKIPMGEIGYGNLSLGAVGAQVSIKKSL